MGWAQATTLIVPVITVFGGVATIAVTYGLNQRAGRRERQAKAFAEALATIEDYVVMPYRIRRRLNTPESSSEISAELDKIQARMVFQQAWLQIEAPEVAATYDYLIQVARSEAGQQMKDAWTKAPLKSAQYMSLGEAYSRTQTDTARMACIKAMSNALGRKSGLLPWRQSTHLRPASRVSGRCDHVPEHRAAPS
jgi:hypothetical protein